MHAVGATTKHRQGERASLRGGSVEVGTELGILTIAVIDREKILLSRYVEQLDEARTTSTSQLRTYPGTLVTSNVRMFGFDGEPWTAFVRITLIVS